MNKLNGFVLNRLILPFLRRLDQSTALDHVVLPLLRERGAESNYVRHFRAEAEFAWGKDMDEMQSLMIEQTCDLLSLLSTQGDSGFSINFKRHYFDVGSKFGLLSPLKFTANEFGAPYSEDGTMQNKRMSCVFLKGDNIDDINAISWKNIASIDMDGEKNFDGYHGYYHGCVFVIRDLHNSEVIKAGVNISNLVTFQGSHQDNVVPTIEVDDKTNTREDFFCHVTLESLIPSDFYKDYELVDNYNETKHKEEKDYIEQHKMQLVDFIHEAVEHEKNCQGNS